MSHTEDVADYAPHRTHRGRFERERNEREREEQAAREDAGEEHTDPPDAA